MNYIDPFQIPPELLHHRSTEEDINILIGENGSGKSSLLREIAKEYLYRHDTKVIAIANTIYDKFDIRDWRLNALKASSGKNLIKRTLKAVLRQLYRYEGSVYAELGRTLEYLEFHPLIGLRVTGVHYDFESRLRETGISEEDSRQLSYILLRFPQIANIMSLRSESIVFFELYRSTFRDLKDSELLLILEYETVLKKHKIIREVEVYLRRDDGIIPVNHGSSGELTQIASMAFLVMMIGDHSLILIDEPENSLHPKWQTEYVSRLLDLLYRYQPKIVIATHSPLIISSSEITTRNVNIYKGANRQFVKVPRRVYNVEEVYQEFFDVTTPENRFLSQYLVKKLDQLTAGTITLTEFERMILEFHENSFEQKQKAALDGILDIARRIDANR